MPEQTPGERVRVLVGKDDLSRAINLVHAFADDKREPERYRESYRALADRLQADFDASDIGGGEL